MREILPGLYLIESEMGGNRLSLYLLRGERTLLVDSGTAETPEAIIYPALSASDLPEQIDLLLVTHADADHHGGNAAIRAGSPTATILCHELDRPRVESKARHLQGRYDDVVSADDVCYEPEIMTWLCEMIGADTPVDVGLRGGETLGLGDGTRWEILHTPGHTAGHLSLWDPNRRVLIMQDAVLWHGVPNRQGEVPSPPPYYDVADYMETLQRLQSLEPEWLLTAHYPIMQGAEAAEFFEVSQAFVEKMDATILGVVRDADRPLSLNAVIDGVDARLGPFAMRIQWIGPTLAHLKQHTAEGRLRVNMLEGQRTWEVA